MPDILPNLDQARQRQDPPTDALLAQAMATPEGKAQFYAALQAGGYGVGEYIRAEAPELYAATSALPPFAKRGWRLGAQRVFAARGPEIMLLLGLYALPYCYAAANGARVLAATERLGPGKALVRLQETGSFVTTVLTGTEQEANHACLHVRVIHALVRYHLGQRGWDNAAWGAPINQEDMAGTNLAFGYIIARGLRKIGLPLRLAEQEEYLGWFAVLGYWLGVETALLPTTPADCHALEQAIITRQHAPSAEGRMLTKALLDALKEGDTPTPLADNAPALMRHLLTDPIADMLDVPLARHANLGWLQMANQFRTLVGPGWTGLGMGDIAREGRRYSVKP